VSLIDSGWEATSTEPGAVSAPAELTDLPTMAARVPGTAALALADAGSPAPAAEDLDGRDWWFRTRFAGDPDRDEPAMLELDGIATVSEVYLNGELVLESTSMFAAHSIDVSGKLGADNELAICCRALSPLLAERRKPRARWRTRLVGEGNLRFFRTMIAGRAPGFAPGPAAVGPWRPVRLRRRRGTAVERLRLRTRLEGDEGVLAVELVPAALPGPPPGSAEVVLTGPSGEHRARLDLRGGAEPTASGELRIPGVERWWPHTHGEPVLHEVSLELGQGDAVERIAAGRVGFRSLAPGPAPGHEIEAEGLALHVNGVAVFARGAVWTPIDPVGLAPADGELRSAVEAARDAGMNMLRIPGTGAYESPAFHEICDELGVLVWQDFMFANLDYPIADPGFREMVSAEAAQVTAALAGHPSLAVLCGNSEVEQQAAMFGVDPALGRGELFEELLPAAARDSGLDAIYVPSAPCGGDLPFRSDRGIASYFGVGGYRRPLGDARQADVRFAAECLAFANVPDDATLAAAAAGGAVVPHDEAWKSAVARDVGSDWDFDDVRDHYLGSVFGLDPDELRTADPQRYLELSRAVSGEVMAEVLGEWRRAGSRCAGAIILWLRDRVPGAGWGVIDSRGLRKEAYHHVRRALQPQSVWTTDEGLGGIRIHVANDRGEPLRARLRVGVFRDRELPIERATDALELPPHSGTDRDLEGLLGHFIDASLAYRFGPPGHDLIVVTLEHEDGRPISQSFRFPGPRPIEVETAEQLGLEAEVEPAGTGPAMLTVRSRRLAYDVRVGCAGHLPGDDAFSIEPGGERTIPLLPTEPGASLAGVTLTAINLDGRIEAQAAR
jgi:beta-mannosidase